jgi:aspartyl-tRNA(Asn)/glutamyl-tRNA(Gln) amidotransferase subunit A
VTDPWALSAVELRARYKRRELSPVEVARAVLDRLDALEPRLAAFVTPTPELALQQAEAAERAYAEGSAGPLAGVPLSIKDLTATAGIRTTRGSLLHADEVPTEDAPLVERLYGAGAVMLGKTNTSEYGWKGDSSNRVRGSTQNPWREGRTAGGSSGGAAAAVAAGIGPIAQGSDGAGSIRIPAAFCGVFGIKPSFGRVPQWPAGSTLSHAGPIARTVADAALMLDVMEGADARDRWSLPQAGGHLAAAEAGTAGGERGDALAGLRVAWSRDLGFAAVEPAVADCAEAAARRLAELGAEVEEAHPDAGDPYPVLDVIWSCRMAGLFGARLPEIEDRLDPGLVEVVRAGACYSGADYGRAVLAQNAYAETVRRFFQRYDLLLTPTLPVTAFAAGEHGPGTVAGTPRRFLEWTAFTYPFNLTGQPAATAPCGEVQGLPVGLQLVGRWREDASVLHASAAFEVIAPWAERWPSLAGAP